MKEIKIIRGGVQNPYKLDNGDSYDSIISIYENNNTIFLSKYCNTDHTTGYKGGILKEGSYYGICGLRANEKGKAIFLYDKKFGIDNPINKIQQEAFILPSLVDNPNHNNKKIITNVLIHRGGYKWDYSHGCITILENMYDKFIKLFQIGEFAEITLIRGDYWYKQYED